uniref:RNA polymerase II-associated factor 1 homolog n=1 Tax=Cyprinus carpio TaxID=7962 RepID=A0A8C2KL07_CYPCA
MAPTIQTQAQREDGHRSGVVCRVKYGNSLPDIPFDPKFITYPFDQHRCVTGCQDAGVLCFSSLDELCEPLHKEPEAVGPAAVTMGRRRGSEQTGPETGRAGMAFCVPLLKDSDSAYRFLVSIPIAQHYSKPRVMPVEVLPVFPDFKMWINPCAQVIFDSDPAPKDVSAPAGVDMMSQAMIRGMMDEEGNQFVAYFLPNEDTMRKRKRDVEEDLEYMPDELYDYKIAREYNWNVKNKASKGYEENYFFIFRDGDGVYYNELETRVRLSKRRAKVGAQSSTNAVLVCKHRDMNEKELEAQEARKAQLENHEPKDEEEELDLEKDLQDSGNTSTFILYTCSEREDEERPADEDEEEEEEVKQRRERKSSGSESGEDRQARDEEEIFGSDDDSEEDEGERARSNSSSVQHSGSERASDSSDASDSE